MKKVIYAQQAPAPIGPYSQAILSGNTLYISGQIAIDQEQGVIITETIEAETSRVMKNLGLILEAAGSDFSKVIKCSIFVKNMNNFSKINEVYGKYFPNDPPVRETVEVSRLPKDVNVEISCIAIV